MARLLVDAICSHIEKAVQGARTQDGQLIAWIGDDELVEVTPKAIRLGVQSFRDPTKIPYTGCVAGRLIFSKRIVGGLAATIAAAVTSLAAARGSMPAGYHGVWSLLSWICSGQDMLASSAAVVGGISAGYSIWQMLAPQEIVTDPGSEHRDNVTHRLLTGDLVERVETAIDAGTLDPEQLGRLAETLKRSVLAESDATPDQAARFAETAVTLAQSENAEDRRIADQVIEGRPEEAADALIAEAHAGKQRNAARFKQAARLYAPFAPSKAMEAYREAVDLDPQDVWSWIELGRLSVYFGTLADARGCFNSALQHVGDERDRMPSTASSAIC